ncbi:hypothetical protein KJK41_12840 [Bacillus haikouensis]|jgi:hypothetical protein|nr:hypothetical protein KJK41_12840 [Bacillus haikouensis]
MRNKVVMVMLVLGLALSVVLPAGAKGPVGSGDEAMLKRWEERGIFKGIGKLKKDPHEALSRLEFAALIHRLVGNGKEEMPSNKASILKYAKELGYWDEVFGEGADANSAVKRKKPSRLSSFCCRAAGPFLVRMAVSR